MANVRSGLFRRPWTQEAGTTLSEIVVETRTESFVFARSSERMIFWQRDSAFDRSDLISRLSDSVYTLLYG